MATKNDYLASKRSDGQWVVQRYGSKKPISLYKTQFNAWKEARRLARGAGSEAFLIGRNGQILTNNSYSPLSQMSNYYE